MLYNKEKILEIISNMSIIEISELISMIEKKFSISSNKTNEINEENSNKNIENKINNFNIILESVGNNKISVIKSIRSIIDIGLKESKDLVDSCPVIIKKNISKEELDKIKKILEKSGAILKIEKI